MRSVKARAECAMGDREAAQGTLRKVGRPRIAATILANCTGE